MAGRQTSRSGKVRGFWSSVWRYRGSILRSVDFAAAFLVAIAALWVPTDQQVTPLARELAPAVLGVASALVGVVVAGLAVIVVFLDDSFVNLMDDARMAKYGGMEGHLFPFWFVTATGVATILAAVALMMLDAAVPPFVAPVPRVLFATTLSLLVWTALGVYNLVASLQATGVTRALWLKRHGREE